MADFDSQLPIRSLAVNNCTEIANSGGTTIDPVEEFAQASATAGQKGPLIQGAVTTAAPSYTTGNTDPLSLTPGGALRVDGSGATQPVSGTVTANQGTPNSLANGWPVELSDGTNLLGTPTHPVRVDPTGTTTQPISGTVTANAGTGNFAVNLAQVAGTTTDVNTGNASAGTQRVVIATNQPAIPVSLSTSIVQKTYYQTATKAAAAVDTHTVSPASTESFDGFTATGSGQIKAELKIGTTGAETTRGVWFSSKGHLDIQVQWPYPITITNTQSIVLLVTNTDNQSQDVYSTILTHA